MMYLATLANLLPNGRQKVTLIFALLLFAGTLLQASSHREAPLIANDPLADNVDVYAFRSPDDPDMITLIATYVPLQLPQGGPNYYSFGENVCYEIHIDNNTDTPGDDIIYRFTFFKENEDPSTFFNIRLGQQNLKTTYTLERSTDGGASFTTVITDGIVPPPNIGQRSINSGIGLGVPYEDLIADAITTASSGETVFCGTSDDPFFVDLGGIFDLGNAPRQDGPPRDGLACLNVSTIAIKVPITTLLKDGVDPTPDNILDPDFVIGVWASASRPAITTLTQGGGVSTSGDWVQVSRLGMPLTNEAVIPVGQKDFWNAITPYDEFTETTLDEYFYNPELALYMDDDQFGGAVPAFAQLRVQRNALQAFDFGNGQDGLFGIKGSPAVAGTALDDAVFGELLLPGPGKPRSVDLWPAFHTGVPNFPPYQLATGKEGNPLAEGKPFVNNFLPNGGDMLRLNMAVPPTPRDSDNFSNLGLIQAAVLGLTNPDYNTTTDIQFILNMDGFPNGRRLEDDVTRIELQAVGGVVLAAIGLWYDDYTAGDPNPVTQDLIDVLSFTTGVERNDVPFKNEFPYVATPFAGDGDCGGKIVLPPTGADLELSIAVDNPKYEIYETVSYTISITNKGPDTAGDVIVSTPLPDGMVYTSDNPSKGDLQLFFEQWKVGSLSAGETATLELVLFTLVEGQPITNFVQVKGSNKADPDSTPDNDTDQTPDEDDEAAVTITPFMNIQDDASNRSSSDASEKASIIKMYPIPATTQLMVEIEGQQDQEARLMIFDVNGKLVKQEAISLTPGKTLQNINISNLTPGNYFIRIPEMMEEGQQKMFIKTQSR